MIAAVLVILVLAACAAPAEAFSFRSATLVRARQTENGELKSRYTLHNNYQQQEKPSFSKLFQNKKMNRNDEGKEYFESEFDRKPLEDRLPLALGFLGIVSLPFIVGLIYLYTNK
ncbi:hypothetical protein B484DRAFT_448966 [Ochromonadaceae sp. CCMP2298]|nr:hypothetical protein B484DRAFT_448966 [Ochromonadaceae sp. CCMP2298]